MKPILSDEQLIDQFLIGEKEQSEAAFETLLKRHGPMVREVCRHVLRQDHDAEDAFQATFLALARKASTIRNRRALSYWLRMVAYRLALHSRKRRAQLRMESQIPDVEQAGPEPATEAGRNELLPVLRAQIDSLPAKYRSLVFHSYIEGNSNEQVAGLLRSPVGTVKGGLSRARGLLRVRLSRRGWDADEVRCQCR
jgi:RNA polymerase sigma-70 factor (ECF subfamily)